MGRMMKLAMAGLAAISAYKFAKGGSGRENEARRDGRNAIDGQPSRKDWDEVDEASYESFPASDPPSHSRGKL
jgi:hypothetical protein